MPILTRQEAVIELLDGAIAAWFDGRHACAITLAGAAEGAMPRTREMPTAFEALRHMVAIACECTEEQAGTMLNANRNWLKHSDGNKPNEIDTEHAWVMILRAYAQYLVTYENSEQTAEMRRFQEWFKDQFAPVRDLLQRFFAFVEALGKAVGAMWPQPPTA